MLWEPDINQWTFIASMNEERRNASCTTLKNKIYICGGQNYYRDLNTAEYYNPDTNQWTLITPMRTPRYELGVIAYMGHIFAVGGMNGSRCYDSTTNSWSVVSSSTDRPDYDFVRCCVISGLPNMAKYCSPREPIISGTLV
uniref:Kelch-like protein n=1 Tax=Gouania willdenowi TaxID=441366 RepID=A0A8C5HGE2_GOUWI